MNIDPNCVTAEQGAVDAAGDFAEDWVEFDGSESDEAALRQHLVAAVGASEEYINGYVAKLRELME